MTDSVPPIIRLSNLNWVSSKPGAVRFVQTGVRLPEDQQAQERTVAELFAKTVLSKRNRSWTDLESCEDDPPDVAGVEAGVPFGVELGEIRSHKRTRGSATLESFVKAVHEGLADLRPMLKGRVFRLTFLDPLAIEQPLPRGKKLRRLVRSTVEAISQAANAGSPVALPEPLAHVVPQAGVPLDDDPRLPNADDPLLTVDARTMATDFGIVSEVTSRIARSKLRRVTTPQRNYLLLWSRDPEFHLMFPVVRESLKAVLNDTPQIPYDEVFLFALPHLDRVLGSGFEIPADRRHG